jgi:hypothetical protein
MAKPWERRKDLNTLISNRTANDSGIKITCMPHHIPIGQIHPHLQQTIFIRYHLILTLLNVPWSYDWRWSLCRKLNFVCWGTSLVGRNIWFCQSLRESESENKRGFFKVPGPIHH